jgi:transcriptional regulator with PAS, ATPase and Fis domain
MINSDIDAAARSHAKVLITGETGAGKEVVARLIHQRSARRLARMATINCAGFPDSLLESELFGHTRGSFTGAYRDRPGVLEAAANGTVFLDELGEMSMRMQTVLLRFLETGELQRVGADRAHTCVNVRVIAATNRDLMKQLEAGTFREDLYHRLNVIRIHVPALRERREDIPAMLDYFLQVYRGQYGMGPRDFAREAIELLVAYRWPGNIRELKNVVERLVIRSDGRAVEPLDLPAEIRREPQRAMPAAAPPEPARLATTDLLTRMMDGGESFWATVYPLFMSRDLSREQLRAIVKVGLERVAGNYRLLVPLFNMPQNDYKRFLTFLRKHDCQPPFRVFRAASISATRAARVGTVHARAVGM